MKLLETPRLNLISTTHEHAHFVQKLVTSPKWIKNIGPREVDTDEALTKFVDHIIASQEFEMGVGQFIIQRKSDKELLGVCGAYKREGLEEADIGFAVLEEFERNGYAFEASQAVLQNIKTLKSMTKIQGITIPENIPSIKILEKLGLSFVKMISLPNDSVELMLYELNLEAT